MSDIKKLLSKKGWTGKELGQIEVSNMAYNFSQRLQGKDPKPLVSKGEFRKMLSTLTDPEQGKEYNRYLDLHNWLSVTYNITSAQEQQAQSHYKTFLQFVSVFTAIEAALTQIEGYPLIMTQKQYNDFIAKRTEEILRPDGEDLYFNLFHTFREALESLVNRLQKYPRKANPLKALKPKLEKQKVTDPRILSRYNDVMGNGYYTIDETGERSDQMTPEEWEEAITLDDPEPHDATEEKISRTFTISKARYNGASKEEIKKIEEELDAKYNNEKPCTFHLYDDPPEDLNNWEILQTGDLSEYYRSLISLSPDGEELTDEDYEQAVTDDIKAFKKEYPTVFKAVLEDMRQYIGDVVDTPIEEWVNQCATWEYLHSISFYDFDETYLSETSIFKGNYKALFHGVAVLQDSITSPLWEDENGYYKSPNVYQHIKPLTLDKFFVDDPDYADNAQAIENARRLLLDSFYYMLGFNKAIELIIKRYDVPLLETFKFDTSLLAGKMEGINDLVRTLYVNIEDKDYMDQELKQKRLQVIKEFFYPLEYEDLIIPQENIDKAIDLLEEDNAFKDANLTSLLCIRQ